MFVNHPKRVSLSVNASDKLTKPKKDTRKAISKEADPPQGENSEESLRRVFSDAVSEATSPNLIPLARKQ